MNKASGPSSGAGKAAITFRRATEADALALARATFLAGERVDMQTLAAQLGIARATLHRWVQTRDALLDRVLGDLAGEYFALGRAQAKGAPDDVIVGTVEAIALATSASDAIRDFVRREPELALRLLLSDRSRARRALVEGLQGLIDEVLPKESARLSGFAEAAVQVGLCLVWPTLVAGDEPSAKQVGSVCRALLVGARAGALPAAD